MNDMDTTTINIQLANGEIVKAEVTLVGGERDVSSDEVLPFEQFERKLEGIISGVAEGIKHALEATAPTKVGLEFGVELGVESGQLTALLVKGTGMTSFKVTVEWGK